MGSPPPFVTAVTFPRKTLVFYYRDQVPRAGVERQIYFFDKNGNQRLDDGDVKLSIIAGSPEPGAAPEGSTRQVMEDEYLQRGPVSREDLRMFGKGVSRLFKEAREERGRVLSFIRARSEGKCQALVPPKEGEPSSAEQRFIWSDATFDPPFSISTTRATPENRYRSGDFKGLPKTEIVDLSRSDGKAPAVQVDPGRCWNASSLGFENVRGLIRGAEVSIDTGTGDYSGTVIAPEEVVLKTLGLQDDDRFNVSYSPESGASRLHVDLEAPRKVRKPK
ncbi:MAG: hypothetical protein HYS22_03990 [Deltaproteobacteria bacterium]|nr:hypothetical protein [Deltaproteobacteria bacterium]